MKTAEFSSVERFESWVVDVQDVRDLEKNLPGYRRRFTFTGEDAAIQAWDCCAKAINSGFTAVAEKVKRV